MKPKSHLISHKLFLQMKKDRQKILIGLLFTIAVLAVPSCIPHEKMVSFQTESTQELLDAQYIQDVPKISIQVDDILAITVSTFDSTAAKVFNSKRTAAGPDGSFIGQGYLVDEDGFIDFPVLGKLKMMGLTRDQAKDSLRNRLLTYLRDPVVDVRFLNLHVSVMGEVLRPGIYTFSDERFTVLEALTMAGDLTVYANREDILVIREKGKVREFGIVDLSSAKVFESPYFYLTQNDVVYVKSLKQKAKILEDPWSRVIAITGVTASLAAVIVALTR